MTAPTGVGKAGAVLLPDPSPRLATTEDWRRWREARLRMLADSPDAFMTTLAQAEAQAEGFWRGRVGGEFPTWLVTDDTDTDDTDTAGDAGAVVATGGVFVPEPDPGRRPTAHVVAMWTAAEARGRGLAARILETAVAWCREHGFDDVRLHVTEGNALARRLYLRHGFEPTGDWEPLREGSPLRCEELRLVRTADPAS